MSFFIFSLMLKIIAPLIVPYSLIRNRFVIRCNLVITLLVLSSQVDAQTSTASPYSRYGIGDQQFGGFSKNLGMGGTSFAIASPYSISFSNPASYASLALTTFEAAATGDFYEVRNSAGSGYLNNVSLGYFCLAFPIKNKKLGMSFGLLPYSNVGYDIVTTQTNADTVAEQHKYEGNGGLNQFYMGVGWAPFKNFSIGLNGSFMFGTMRQIRRVEPPEYENYYNTKFTESTVIDDFYFNFGVLKTFDSLAVAKSDSMVMLEKENKKLKDSIAVTKNAISVEIKNQTTEQRTVLAETMVLLEKRLLANEVLTKHLAVRKQKSNWSVSLGATVAPTTKLRGSHSVLAETYIYADPASKTQEVAKDTIQNISDKSGNLILPLSVGVGVCVKQGSRWTIASDFSLQNWKDYSLFGEKDSLANSWRASAGLQWVPNDRSIKSYFSLVQYRLGFHYEQTYLQLHSTQLNDVGISMGFGFPMKRAATTVQTSFEIGRRGTISNDLIELNYFKCSVGFTINDRWFVKPKFD